MRFPALISYSVHCWWSVFVLVSYIRICACVSYLYRYSICVCVRYLYRSCVSGAAASAQTGWVPYNTDHLYVKVLG